MAIIVNENFECACQLAVWKITERLDDLLSRVTLTRNELDTLERFSFEPRKLEWLSVRVLLNEMTGKEHTIGYNGNHKPYIIGNSYFISISHSRDLTAILLSRDKKVGIDLEYMSHRIGSIAHKFINGDDVITTDEEQRKYHLYIHWCAKEALYKICDKQNINFKENLTLDPFEPMEKGVILGRVHNRMRNEPFTMNYFSLGNYVVVWCCK
jgi:4'-phosphopantetheinyl transferase